MRALMGWTRHGFLFPTSFFSDRIVLVSQVHLSWNCIFWCNRGKKLETMVIFHFSLSSFVDISELYQFKSWLSFCEFRLSEQISHLHWSRSSSPVKIFAFAIQIYLQLLIDYFQERNHHYIKLNSCKIKNSYIELNAGKVKTFISYIITAKWRMSFAAW